uniref:hypothetical protein n=1 Tax=Rahnella sp. RFA10(1/100) TaxID=2511202 RepID=UPI00101F196E|nr:hypothetical protein [Rahnella sp. RFA10(1/100)]
MLAISLCVIPDLEEKVGETAYYKPLKNDDSQREFRRELIGVPELRQKKNLRIRVGWCKFNRYQHAEHVDDSPINTSGTFNLAGLGESPPAGNRNIIPQNVTSGENRPDLS